MWSSLKNSSDAALLFARAVLGLLFLCFHGWPRLHLEIISWGHHGARHSLWNSGSMLAIAVAETLAGILLILGLWTRPACLLFGILVGWALFNSINAHGGSIGHAENSIELFLLLVLLFILGPGRFSIDKG